MKAAKIALVCSAIAAAIGIMLLVAAKRSNSADSFAGESSHAGEIPQ